MPKLASFDHTQPAPQRVTGWLDTDDFTYATMPANADLLTLTQEQWDGRMDDPSGWAVSNGTLAPYVPPPPVPPSLQQTALMRLGQPVTVASTSIPALNGSYPIDPNTQGQITGIAAAISADLGLPGGGTTFRWSGVEGWTAPAFIAFAKAVMNYVYAVAQVAEGHSDTLPSQTLTLP